MEGVWETFSKMITKTSEEKFDFDLLLKTTKIWEVTLGSHFRWLKNPAIEFWNITFGKLKKISPPHSSLLLSILKKLANQCALSVPSSWLSSLQHVFFLFIFLILILFYFII